jgi:phage baseplate assembly protein W
MADFLSNTAPGFLGTGWKFPPTISSDGQSVEMLSGEDDIRSSLQILMGTRPGERPLHPDFGIGLEDLLYEPVNTTLRALVQDNIRTAILLHEPRIRLLSVEMEDQFGDGLLNIRLSYEVRTTNSRFNLVFPFYLTDSSEQRTLVTETRR